MAITNRNPLVRAAGLLFSCLILPSSLLLCAGADPAPVPAETAAVAPSSPAPKPKVVRITAWNTDGYKMADARADQPEEWFTFSCGEPLTLRGDRPLSIVLPPADHSQCPVTPEALALVNYDAVLRGPAARTRSPYPAYPADRIYRATLSDGTAALLRLPAASKPQRAEAIYDGQTYPMQPITALELARLQTAGDAVLPADDQPEFETRIMRLDNLSLVASADKVGQAELLTQGATLVRDLLELYHQRHAVYPATLADLASGDNAVIAALPRNSYAWDQTYADTDRAGTGLPGTLRYVHQRSAKHGKADGYWLGMQSGGLTAMPKVALPTHHRIDHVVLWLENHPAKK